MREKEDFLLLQPRPFPKRLSLVIPVYNEAPVVGPLRAAVQEFVAHLPTEVEIIVVNDGSTDSTLRQLVDWVRTSVGVTVLNLSRNFGHQVACTAGLDYATGDAVVLLDADLQDPLNVVPRMIERYCDGYDVIYGQRVRRRGEAWPKRLTAWLFYRLMRLLMASDLPLDTGDFRLLSRNCLDALQQMRETHRFFRGMVAWVGFAQTGVQYERQPRIVGRSKYPLRKMLSFAWTAATSFSTLPLRGSMFLGLIITTLGVAEGTWGYVARLIGMQTVRGWPLATVLISILGGANLLSLGILGEYIGKLYEQSKGRPLYLVSQTVRAESIKAAEVEPRFGLGRVA